MFRQRLHHVLLFLSIEDTPPQSVIKLHILHANMYLFDFLHSFDFFDTGRVQLDLKIFQELAMEENECE